MSGIAIVYDPLQRQQDNLELVARMGSVLRRSDRAGPSEIHIDAGIAAAHVPTPFDRWTQPAWNEDRTIGVFFHGELFGWEETRKRLQRAGYWFSGRSPAEFVALLYEEAGDAFVQGLNGNFVLVLWDNRRRRLIIANDRYGLSPLYTAQFQGRHYWASSPKALLADPAFPRKTSLAAMADFFCLSIPQGDATIIDGVQEEKPASLIVCQDGMVNRRRYWEFSLQEDETGVPAEEYRDELTRLLRQSAKRRQTNGLRIGVLLSGGLDSRIVLSMLDRSSVKTFTFGRPGSSDAVFADAVARVAHVPHSFLEIRPDYLRHYAAVGIERTADLLNCNQYHGISVYDEIARHADVLITGSSGEDVFGHYRRDPKDEVWSEGFTIDRYYDMKSTVAEEDLAEIMLPSFFKQMKGLARERFRADLEFYNSRHVPNMLDRWSVCQQQRRLYNRLSLLFPDGLGYRPFFFDNDLMEFVGTIPPSLRWGEKSVYRAALLHAAPELAALPATTTNGFSLRLNKAQRYRRAHIDRWRWRISRCSGGLVKPAPKVTPYVDYEGWLRGALREWVMAILTDPRTMSRGLWNAASLRVFLDDFMQGRPVMKGAAKIITAIISFELWYRRCFEAEVADEPKAMIAG